MPLIEQLYALTTAVLALTGLAMTGLALRAYVRTSRTALIHLAFGFVLIVAAAVTTAVSAFLLDFRATGSILAIHSGMTGLGYLFVIYSLTERNAISSVTASRRIGGESTNTR